MQFPPKNDKGDKPDQDQRNNGQNNPTPNFEFPRWAWFVLFGVLLSWLFVNLTSGNPLSGSDPLEVVYSDFLAQVEAGNVESVTIRDNTATGEFNQAITYPPNPQEGESQRTSDTFETTIPPQEDSRLLALLTDSGVSVGAEETTINPFLLFLAQWAPFLLIIAFLVWMARRAQRQASSGIFGFGQSQAREYTSDFPQVTFDDVAGQDSAKSELMEVVDFLKEPDKYISLGARIPRGVLLIGPPGTGKTLMARAVAGEANVAFFSLSASEFVEMFVGVGASRVRDLFKKAKDAAPSIVFIDEIDAVGRQRGAGLGGGNDEREQTLNQLLAEMDGFDQTESVIVMAATNRPDVLDPALLRPGRFDRKVTMDTPDLRGRLDILKVHARGKPLSNDVDLEAIAKITPGMSGADLENLLNEAALLAARRSKRSIGMSELNEAMERVAIGPARKSRVMSEKEKRTVAYHEGGHAILFYMLEHTNPVHKITIIPRGRAGGYVLSLPESDNNLRTREQFEDSITATMGGRAAEEIAFGQITNGASGDLQQATNLSRAMVTQFGMSETLGPRTFGSDSGNPFLGRGWADDRDYSEDAARQIDVEIQRITSTAYERAVSILRGNRDKLEMLANILIERETLERVEFEYLMEHGELPGDMPDVSSAPDITPDIEPPRLDTPDHPDTPDAEGSGSSLGPAPA